MSAQLIITQLLNGLQLGLLLFLVAAGLTLVLGIMDVFNLAHGSLYTIGAFMGASFAARLDSFVLGALCSLPVVFALGLVVERLVVRHLYHRDHLDQVLATFGLILVLDSATQLLWGAEGLTVALPDYLQAQFYLGGGIMIPRYRLLIIITGLTIAIGLYAVINHSRAGMMIRASAANRTMAASLGININLLFSLVFAAGASLAGVAGLMMVPITEASIGMGNNILIIVLVVIIIGGLGSVLGAFVAALLIGLVDTMGRVFLDDIIKLLMSAESAETAAPALSSMLIYILMAALLYFKPAGLFPPKGR